MAVFGGLSRRLRSVLTELIGLLCRTVELSAARLVAGTWHFILHACGYSRRGERSPRLCCRTVRESCPSHGSSTVWCLSRTPLAFACRLLHVAIPMSQLPVREGISPPLCARDAMIDFQPVSGFERVSAICTSAVLSLQESRDSPGDSGMVCTPATPGDCIAIVGAAPPLHVHVPLNRRLGVATQPLPTGARQAVPLPILAPPVLLVAPLQRLVRMTTPAPRAEWWAQLFVHRLERRVTPDGGAVVAPASEHRVQRRDETCLCVHSMSAHHCPPLSLMTCHRLPARLDDRLVAALGRRGVWPKVEAQEVKPGLTLLSLHGLGDAGLARLPGQSQAVQWFRQQRLTARDHCPLWLEDEQIIRLAHPSRRSTGKRSRARLFQSVQGHLG
jgi:hypothetical protein